MDNINQLILAVKVLLTNRQKYGDQITDQIIMLELSKLIGQIEQDMDSRKTA